VLSRVPKSGELRAEIGAMRDELRRFGRFGRLVGRSAAHAGGLRQDRARGADRATVLVLGESGTGKKWSHAPSTTSRAGAKHAFLAINCGAISPNLIENEIFGHERGSYTGADRQHKGYFEQANEGTLFLDEITEMPLELQVRLLRVLETGSLMRIGHHPHHRDRRSHPRGHQQRPARSGSGRKLREDLYHRLNVFPLAIAPLRERADDVELIASTSSRK